MIFRVSVWCSHDFQRWQMSWDFFSPFTLLFSLSLLTHGFLYFSTSCSHYSLLATQLVPSLGHEHPLGLLLCPSGTYVWPQKSLRGSSPSARTESPKLTCAFPHPDPESTISLRSHSYSQWGKAPIFFLL